MGALIATANTAKEVGDLCSGQKWAWLWAGEESNGEGRGGVWLARHVVYRNVQFVFIQRKMKLSSSYSIIL